MVTYDFKERTIDVDTPMTGKEVYQQSKELWENGEHKTYIFPLIMVYNELLHVIDYTLTPRAINNIRSCGVVEIKNKEKYEEYLSIVTLVEPKIDLNTGKPENDAEKWDGELIKITPFLKDLFRELDKTYNIHFMHTLGINDLVPIVYRYPGYFYPHKYFDNYEQYEETNPEWFI